WNTTGSRIRQTDSGMEYLVLGTGQGDKPVPGQVVEVHYSGFLENGTLFDSSYLRAEPLQFTLNTGYVIQGLENAIADMRIGEKRTVFIPSSLAYGAEGIPGIVPPNARLRFDIELLQIVSSRNS